MSLYEYIKKAQHIRISKQRIGSIAISFSLLEGDYKQMDLKEEEYFDLGFGPLKFKLSGRSIRGNIAHLSFTYNPFEDMVIMKNLKFITINKNVKQFYDSFLMIDPLFADYQEGDTIYFVKEVENTYGISGWSVREILDKLKDTLPIRIDSIDVPSFLDYRLSSFVVRQGSNIVNTIQALFPNMVLSVFKLGDRIIISSNRNKRSFVETLLGGFDYCIEDSYSVTQLEIDNIYLRGDYSSPDYLEGTGEHTVELTEYISDNDRIEKKLVLNEIGRIFAVKKEITVKKIRMDNVKMTKSLEGYGGNAVIMTPPDITDEIQQLEDGTLTNII